jgi:hypothetical protein
MRKPTIETTISPSRMAPRLKGTQLRAFRRRPRTAVVRIASIVMHALQAWASVQHRSSSIDKRVYASI